MIRKLQRQFVCITMALVTVVLLVLFSVLCIITYTQQAKDSETALRYALNAPKGSPGKPPELSQNGDKGELRPFDENVGIPTFCVFVDNAGQVRLLNSTATVNEEQVLAAVKQALELGENGGVLSSLELRFLVENTQTGKRIAFADMRGDNADMRHLLLLSLGIFVGALAVFFGISLLLSKIAVRPVEKAWSRQQQFIADASHELKTPLTVMLANTDIVLGHPEQTVEQQRKWIEYTKTEAQRMRGLVEDLLFLAKADGETAQKQYATVLLSDTVLGCVLPFESVAFERSLTLEHNIAENLAMLGDKRQIEQLTVILLDNACKYTAAGGNVRVRLTAASDNRALLSVNNCGGELLTKEQAEHLFERFYRVDSARTRESGGYGLGLSIAHTIVEAHRGKISVESSPAEGITFHVWLPILKS